MGQHWRGSPCGKIKKHNCVPEDYIRWRDSTIPQSGPQLCNTKLYKAASPLIAHAEEKNLSRYQLDKELKKAVKHTGGICAGISGRWLVGFLREEAANWTTKGFSDHFKNILQ